MLLRESLEEQRDMDIFSQYKKTTYRKYFCQRCWTIMNAYQKKRHLQLKPNCSTHMLTPRYFATNEKFLKLA